MADHKEWQFDREEQRRLKIDLLLKVAAECFNNKGFSGTSLKDVARKLNITDAALYYYVKNKEELVNLCYMRAINLGEAALNRAMEEGKDPLDKIQLYVRYQIEEICGKEGPVAILSEIPALKPKHRDQILKKARAFNNRFTALIEEGVKDGSIRASNPIATSDAILGAVNWIPKWYKPNSGLNQEEITSSFIELFVMGLSQR